jgi:pyruvate kinase
LTLNWAVYPLVMEFDPHNLDKNIDLALKTLLGRRLLYKGNTVVVVSSISAGGQVVDAVQMRVV